MVRLLEGFLDHIVAYEARGRVNRREYESIVMNRVDEVGARYNKIDFLVILKTDFENYTFAAFIDYLLISFKHFARWNRMAIVTDEDWIRHAYHMLSVAVPGEIRGYRIAQSAQAKAWVTAASGANDKNSPVLTAAAVSTAAMTAYSYARSATISSNFREPEILSDAIRKWSGASKTISFIAGSLLHFAAGLTWTATYKYLIRKGLLSRLPYAGISTGLLSGVTAVIIWGALFRLHPRPPKLRYSQYYRHLVAAHLVFTIVALSMLRRSDPAIRLPGQESPR